MKKLTGLLLCTTTGFALAQSHTHDHNHDHGHAHAAHGKSAEVSCSPEHAAMGHCELPAPTKNAPTAPACSPEHAAMGHCTLTSPAKNAPIEPHEPIPPVTEQDRAAAFPLLRQNHLHASNTYWLARMDRLEIRDGGQAWEGSFKYGGDIQRLLLQSEGKRTNHQTQSAHLNVFYSRSFTPWWDVRIGVRQEFEPRARTFAAIGISGIPFYALEVATVLYTAGNGQWQGKFNADYDLRLTNRLILQPSLEVKAALKSEHNRAIGTGLGSTETALRLRYEITRQLAPYLGVAHKQSSGKTADFARNKREHIRDTHWVLGVKLWF